MDSRGRAQLGAHATWGLLGGQAVQTTAPCGAGGLQLSRLAALAVLVSSQLGYARTPCRIHGRSRRRSTVRAWLACRNADEAAREPRWPYMAYMFCGLGEMAVRARCGRVVGHDGKDDAGVPCVVMFVLAVQARVPAHNESSGARADGGRLVLSTSPPGGGLRRSSGAWLRRPVCAPRVRGHGLIRLRLS